MKTKADTSFFSQTKRQSVSNSIPLIQPSDFYKLSKDTDRDEQDNNYLKPKKSGSELIARYYALKYGTKITFLDNPLSLTDLLSALKGTPQRSNYREAFLMDMHKCHGWPVFYIKEGNKEALLIADSIGVEDTNKKLAADIESKLNIDIYFVKKSFQGDLYSCYTHSLILGRDITSFNQEKNNYQIENLLDSLIKRGKETDAVDSDESSYSDDEHEVMKTILATLLPDSLLKTCQSREILKLHKQDTDNIIHKNETLEQFRNRYTQKTKSRDWYDYLRQKGLKFARIIHIQYYLEQLNTNTEEALTREEQMHFIKEAKRSLGEPSDKSMAEILQNLVQQFLSELVENKVARCLS